MKLLCELLEVQEKMREMVLEDLSSVKKAGLGRMANAFKQSYYFHTGNSDYGPHTSDVGKPIHARMTGVSRDSEVVVISEPVTGWPFVKKMYKNNLTDKTGKGNPVAVVFYIAGKAVALLIMGHGSFSTHRSVVGLSWDFTGVGSDDDVKHIIDGIELHDHTAGHVIEKKTDSRKSEQSHTFAPDHGKEEQGPEIRHYQGIGVTIKDAAGVIDRMVDIFDGELRMKLILSDTVRNQQDEPDDTEEKS